MYIAYNFCPSVVFYNKLLNGYVTQGSALYDKHEKNVQECLSAYISSDGRINGTELRENWFSIEESDVFISHSHKDINKVKAFAGWLYEEFGLTSFIDSCAWGYCDKLLNIIDKRYCYNKDKRTYDYDLRNYTTSHVHMMLSTALVETMNRSECVIFFNTPNSICMSDELSYIRNKEVSKTTSPWILYELTMISRLNRTKPDRKKSVLEHMSFDSRESLNIEYDVTKIIDDIPTLNTDHLIKWNETHGSIIHPLDELYKITGLAH